MSSGILFCVYIRPRVLFEMSDKPSKLKTKLRGLRRRANYTDRAAAAGRRS